MVTIMVKKATSQQRETEKASTPPTQRRSRKPRRLPQLDTSELLCPRHPRSTCEFLCTNQACLAELCAHCILEHKQHIDEIQPLQEVMRRNLDFTNELHLTRLQNSMAEGQRQALTELEAVSEKIKNLLQNKITTLKEKLIVEDEKVNEYLHSFAEVRKHFVNRQSTSDQLDSHTLNGLKSLLKFRRKHKFNSFVIESQIIEKQFGQLLTDSISLVAQGCSINSTQKDVPKYLHWFEWERKDLHLFDVVAYSHRTIKLTINFKIPPFSRSIIVPDGRIFLAGGEDPESGAKRDLYCFNLLTMNTDLSLHQKANMLTKKYDFSICHHSGYVYVICGKGQNTEILDSCERYDIYKDSWTSIARVSKKRYASSAVVAAEADKIYLFGGRSDYNNQMAEEIEEYNIATDVWTTVVLKNPQDFVPVEVCSAVQVAPGKIIIFGGSDSTINDIASSYVFSFEEGKMESVGALKKAHVFVASPFVFGTHVFAVGNEYYVKNRNIHRYNIETCEWDLIY